MSNGLENTDKELDFNERLELIKALNGVGGDRKPPPDDETYALFTSGDHAGKEFKRIARPSYKQRKAVEEVRLQAKGVSESVKEAICNELGWEMEEKAAEDLSMIEYQEKILPLIVRGSFSDYEVKEWDIENVNSYEVNRMLYDFLLGT